MKTLEHWLETLGLSIAELADRAGLDAKRVASIAEGRWTPSPQDRELLAAALGVAVDQVSWGHTMPPRNIRYHRFGLPEDFQQG